MTQTCSSPVGLDKLLQYWLDELGPSENETIEEHFLSCGHCAAMLEEVAALQSGIGGIVHDGYVRLFATPSFVAALKRRGLRVREYVVACNGSVDCTITPDDDVVVARLKAPLGQVTRLDVISTQSFETPPERITDIPFDPAAGEVLMLPHVASLRLAPDHQQRIELIACEGDSERTLGNYYFLHTAHR